MSWTSTAAAVTNLRELINDGPEDKYADQKACFGVIDGANLDFKTFEFRIVTDFTTSAWPLGVYVGDAIQTGNIASHDQATGRFKFGTGKAPADGTKVYASYYYQWFTDAELQQFMQNASSWLQQGTNYAGIPDGLNAACLRFAAHEAYLKAAMKYSVRAAAGYKLEDAGKEDINKSIQAFRDMAKDFMASAETLRDDFYTRSGQSKAPNMAIGTGNVRDPVPRR